MDKTDNCKHDKREISKKHTKWYNLITFTQDKKTKGSLLKREKIQMDGQCCILDEHGRNGVVWKKSKVYIQFST